MRGSDGPVVARCRPTTPFSTSSAPLMLIPLLALLLLSPPAAVEAFRRLPSDRFDRRYSDSGGSDFREFGGDGDGDGGSEQALAEGRRVLLEVVRKSELRESGGGPSGNAKSGGNASDGGGGGTRTRGAVRETKRALGGKDSPHDLPLPSDHLVASLPLLSPDDFKTRHYAGHLPAGPDPADKKLFYWLFEPTGGEDEPGAAPPDGGGGKRVPLIIWLNGGPGCSSMDGLFLENGPFQLTPTAVGGGKERGWKMAVNPHSWHAAPAWTLYVDQPVGTGLSFTRKKNYCKSDEEVNADFHYFLQQFLLTYGDYFLEDGTDDDAATRGRRVLNRGLFFSGESHAGHYIPSMIDHILRRNDDANADTRPSVIIPVAGAAIGNGWVDPYHQYAAADVAYGMGLIDLAQKAHFDKLEARCQAQMDGGKLDAGVCFDLLDKIVAESKGGSAKHKVSQYDGTKWERKGAPRSFPPGHKDVENYLGGWGHSPEDAGHPGAAPLNVDRKSVLEAIHATESMDAKQRYKECTDPPFDALRHQDGLGVIPELVRILDHPSRPRVLFFNGMNDLICNHVGNERFLDLLPWRHAKDWSLAKRYSWDGPPERDGDDRGSGSSVAPVGYVKEYANLLFLKVLGSGHMVPMDLPRASLEMMRTLLHGTSDGGGGLTFRSVEQKLDRKDPASSDLDGKCEPCPECDGTEQQIEKGEEEQGWGPNPSAPSAKTAQAGGSDGDGASSSVKSAAAELGLGPVAFVLVLGGWVGGLVGVVALIVNYRRGRSLAGRRVVGMTPSADDDDDLDDDDFHYDADLELRESSRDGGVVVGGGGPAIKYRDDPGASAAVNVDGPEGAAATAATTNGTTTHRLSAGGAGTSRTSSMGSRTSSMGSGEII